MTDAVIFAAGAGRRLGLPFPKCLLEFGGRTLLARQIEALTAIDVANIFVVVSYERAMIERAVACMEAAPRISFIINDTARAGSLYSLRAASDHLRDDTILMDGDVLFPARFLADLCRPNRSAILFESGVASTGEEMMVVFDGAGRVQAITRQPSATAQTGESVGFALVERNALDKLLVAIAEVARQDMDGRADWEGALSRICAQLPVSGVDVRGWPWTEIDFPEDVVRGHAIVEEVDRVGG